MKFQKNQEIVLRIDDLGNNGEGIGHVDGYALFVKDALPGETIRAKIMKCRKNFGFARLMDVLIPNETVAPGKETETGRVLPRCPVARQCGGCTLQHLSYEKQLAYKEKKVRDCLERIGGVKDTPEHPIQWQGIMGMGEESPWHYRNKAQFPVRMQLDEEGVAHPVVGFYAGRSHNLIPMTDCAIQHESMKAILESVLTWMEGNRVSAYDEEKHSGLVRHIYIRRAYHTPQIMVCLVVSGDNFSIDQKQTLIDTLRKLPDVYSICLNINEDKTNVILGEKTITLWGQDVIEDTIGSIRYQISPQSFYQVNPVQTEKLYVCVMEFAELTGNETVWDLYCGIGTISLFLAQKAKQVYGVEIVPDAMENARANAEQNNISNVEFYCGAAEQVVPELFGAQESGACADVVVVDPPRKGCDGVLLDTIVKMSPEKIVYVSCDPATLARDVKILGENGYEVRKVRGCDMFPMGGHVESVVLMSKAK